MNVRIIGQEVKLWWKIWLAYSFEVITEILFAAFLILPYLLYGFAIVGGNYSEKLAQITGSGNIFGFMVIGFVVMGIYGGVFNAAGYTLVRQIWMGTIELIISSPTSIFSIVLGDTIFGLSYTAVFIAIQIVIYWIFFPAISLSFAKWYILLLIFLLTLISCYGISLFVNSIAAYYKKSSVIVYIFSSLLYLVSPLVYPLDALPVFLRKVALCFPTTYILELSRHYIVGTRTSFSSSLAIYTLILLTIAWLVIGIFSMKLGLFYLKCKGALTHY